MRLLILFILIYSSAIAQTTGSYLPRETRKSDNYLFYLHGGVVTGRGNNAVTAAAPEWGPYEYLNILDSLKKRGFTVISEVRQQGVDDTLYAQKITMQIDTLLKAGIPPGNIVLVGASAGSNIVFQVSSKVKNDALHFVVMGGCWPGTYKDYLGMELYGRFLSIIEKKDPHGTCRAIFEGRKHLTAYREIMLNTGLSHGFLFKGHSAWIAPIVNWLRDK